MTRMQKQRLRILIKLLVLAPLLSSLDPTGWTPISAFLAQNSALELWVDISSNNCLGSWLWSWEGLLAQSSCPLSLRLPLLGTSRDPACWS